VTLARENAMARRPPHRQPRSRIMIYGGPAETAYFSGLYGWAGNPAVMVRVNAEPMAVDSMIAMADEYRNRHPDDIDEVWCMVDAEDAPDQRAMANYAVEAGVELAVSTPCFETWLLLHHCERALEPTTREGTLRQLRRYLPDYDVLRLDFADFQPLLREAIDRARALDGNGGPPANPSTGVWRLVSRIAQHRLRDL
jgi:RloB-like protein